MKQAERKTKREEAAHRKKNEISASYPEELRGRQSIFKTHTE